MAGISDSEVNAEKGTCGHRSAERTKIRFHYPLRYLQFYICHPLCTIPYTMRDNTPSVAQIAPL